MVDGLCVPSLLQMLAVGELAQEYGFTDVDGSKPPPFQPPTS